MGNQAAAMKNFPYEIGEPYAETPLWRLHHGTKKNSHERVTIFACDLSPQSGITTQKLDLVRTSFKRMKTIRHPNFIKYLDGVELPTHIYVVTQFVQLLSHELESLNNDHMTSSGMSHSSGDSGGDGKRGYQESISWGLFQVISALEFLHSRRMYHCNISMQSIFVDESGDWKIGELGFLSDIGVNGSGNIDENNHGGSGGGAIQHDFAVRVHQMFLTQRYKAPELVSQRWDLVEKYADRLDSWGIACLIYEVFHYAQQQQRLQNQQRQYAFSSASDLRLCANNKVNLAQLPKAIQSSFLQLLVDDPSVRASLSDFMQQSSMYFNNPMIKTQQFLDNLSLKDPVAIDSFLTQLPELLPSFPVKCCKYRMLPLLINAIKFGSSGSKAITSIFMIGDMMRASPQSLDGTVGEDGEFKTEFVPKILELFESTDRTVRLNLLKNLSMILPYLTVEIVEQKIYPHVEFGFKDSSPIIREATVKSMIDLVPKLNEQTVSESVVRNLWTLQGDNEAAIRTNTIIAIGKLSKYMSPKTQKQVLIAAFVRSLKDPFVPSRTASLKALISTRNLYSPADLAQKALPAVVTLTVDVDRGVRDLAFTCVNNFLEVIRACSESPNFAETVGYDAVTAAQKSQASATTNGAPNSSSTPQASSGSTKQQDEEGSYLGWAVSSVSSIKTKLSTSIGGEKGHIGADIKKPVVATKAPQPVSNLGTTTMPAKTDSPAPLIPTKSPTVPVQQQPQQQPKPVAKPSGLKLTHDAPKNDLFAGMQTKNQPSTSNDPFGEDFFADMSFNTNNNGSKRNSGGSSVMKTTTPTSSTSAASSFAPRGSNSSAVVNSKSASATTPVMASPSSSVTSASSSSKTSKNALVSNDFADWDDMPDSNSNTFGAKVDSFFDDVMNNSNDLFSVQKPMKPTRSTNNSNAMKLDKPKSDTPARSRTTRTTQAQPATNVPVPKNNRMAQVRQKDVDDWEDWSWDK